MFSLDRGGQPSYQITSYEEMMKKNFTLKFTGVNLEGRLIEVTGTIEDDDEIENIPVSRARQIQGKTIKITKFSIEFANFIIENDEDIRLIVDLYISPHTDMLWIYTKHYQDLNFLEFTHYGEDIKTDIIDKIYALKNVEIDHLTIACDSSIWDIDTIIAMGG